MVTTLLSLCLCVYQTGLYVEEGWVLKHRGTEEHRGKGLRMRWKMGDESRRPTNSIPASLVSLVAGVFRSPNFIPTQVMVRSEQLWWRLPANLSNQEGRSGSVVSRHRDGPATVLKGWSGFLHADNSLT